VYIFILGFKKSHLVLFITHWQQNYIYAYTTLQTNSTHSDHCYINTLIWKNYGYKQTILLPSVWWHSVLQMFTSAESPTIEHWMEVLHSICSQAERVQLTSLQTRTIKQKLILQIKLLKQNHTSHQANFSST